MPLVSGVKVTEHAWLFAVGLPSVHEPPPKLPDPEATENATVPTGADCVPLSPSVTVAVHVEPWFTSTGVEQEIVVVVVRSVAVMELEIPELAAWTPELAPLGV
ncbi:MAG: hypothetical protein HY534_05290 [Chloroflexi bacterium]|nr:hypothetical protein [Chloroflexota bacterium]